MCCAPFLMRKIISQMFVPQLHTILRPRGTKTHVHALTRGVYVRYVPVREWVCTLQVTSRTERPGRPDVTQLAENRLSWRPAVTCH